jgi:hypothetical protein
MSFWIWLGIAAVLAAIVLAVRALGRVGSQRRELFTLADEFERFLARERPGLGLKRTDLLVPVFHTPDGRRVGWAPLVVELLKARAVRPEDRYPFYGRWADELAAGRIPSPTPDE